MKTWMVIGGLLLATTTALTGCGGDKPADTGGGTTSETSNTSSTGTTSLRGHRLVGIWLGSAAINEEKLQQRMAEAADDQQRQLLQAQAETFMSMLVGAEFAADGTYTLDAELTPFGGQPTREQSAGRWSILQEDGNSVLVGAQEQVGETIETSEKQYAFYDDQRFGWIPNVSEDLRACDAIIIFERQTVEDEIARQDDPTTITQ